MTTNPTKFTHRATLGGEMRLCNPQNWQAVMDELVARYPGQGAPKLEPIEEAPESAPSQAPAAIVRGVTVDSEGAARSAADEAAAIGSGFAVKPPIYTAGTMLLDVGVETAKEKRAEFDAMPTVRDYCRSFEERIASERRRDVTVQNGMLRMRQRGTLVGPDGDLVLDSDAFAKLMSRMAPGGGPGGGDYLSKCPPRLRALNFNHWAAMTMALDERRARETTGGAKRGRASKFQPTQSVLRTRTNPNEDLPEVFGVVSEGYTPFDVDKIASALAVAAPRNARGSVRYDGKRASFDVLFHSTFEPERMVAGEFFRAGVRVSTDDVGGKGIRVSALVWRNLCLNFYIIDTAEQRIASIRHVGDVERLADAFRDSFDTALGKIDHFLQAWGYAVQEDVLERAAAVTTSDVPRKVSEALPGLFAAILERELVPVRGNKREAARRLSELYFADEAGVDAERVSRVAVVNAFTRYAHAVPQPTPFAADEIEQAAGALLFGRYDKQTGGYRAPDPLPYVSAS